MCTQENILRFVAFEGQSLEVPFPTQRLYPNQEDYLCLTGPFSSMKVLSYVYILCFPECRATSNEFIYLAALGIIKSASCSSRHMNKSTRWKPWRCCRLAHVRSALGTTFETTSPVFLDPCSRALWASTWASIRQNRPSLNWHDSVSVIFHQFWCNFFIKSWNFNTFKMKN